MRCKINIDTCKKIDDFIKIINENGIKATLICNDKGYCVQASHLGALCTLEWGEVYLECDKDIKELISNYIIDKD